MITAGKIEEAIEELKCIAKHNGKKLSDESLKMLETFKNASDKGIEIVSTYIIYIRCLPINNNERHTIKFIIYYY